MSPTAPRHATLADCIAADALPFSLNSADELNAAVDRVVADLGSQVEILGFGEPMHGADEFLVLRNRLFRRLVEVHGYSAVAIESSFPMGFAVDRFVNGEGPADYQDVSKSGFGHQMGKLEANRELVEWMRAYNAAGPRVPLRFYGFDIPTAPAGIGGPRAVLPPALEFLSEVDDGASRAIRERVEAHLGDEAAWENPAAYFDPSKSIGLSPEARALRLAVEDLINEFQLRRTEWIDAADAVGLRRDDARQHRAVGLSRDDARQHRAVGLRRDDAKQHGAERYGEGPAPACRPREGLLNYHASVAGKTGPGTQLGIRDAIMADTLAYISARERAASKNSGGKVLVFAHNAHLQRGGKVAATEAWRKAMNAAPFAWWPAGAHLDRLMGSRYAAIGAAVGESTANGIGPPESESLEAQLTEAAGSTDSAGLFLPTAPTRSLSAGEIETLPLRSGSATNLSYIPLGPQSLTDFDCLAVLKRATYYRGVPPPSRPTEAIKPA